MSHKKILIAENKMGTAEKIRLDLEDLGYVVPAITSSSVEVLEMAEKTQPDLVLMDIALKGNLDSLETARCISHRHNIPVVYLVAHKDGNILEQIKTADPFGCLFKPFEKIELCAAIEIALCRQATERKLKENEHRLVITLKSIADAVITTDNKGLITFMNPIAETLTGWQHVDARGKDLTDVFQVVNEETRKAVEDPVSKVLRGDIIMGFANHTLVIAKDGTEIPIDDSAAPIKDDQDNITGVVLVFHDITERRRAEEALAKERNLLRTLIDNLPDYIYIKDTESRFINGNISVAQIMGAATPDNLIGKTDFDFYPEDLAVKYCADERTIIQSGQAMVSQEEPCLDPDGNQKWLSTTKVPLRDSQGQIVGVVGIGRDVTEQKQVQKKLEGNLGQLEIAYEQATIYAEQLNQEIKERQRMEETLAEERNLLRTLIDNLPDYVYVKDTKSRFINGNLAVAQVMGAANSDELIGKTDFDFYPKELAMQFYTDEQAVIESGQPLINREERIINQVSDEQNWISTTKTPLRDSQGQIIGLVGMGRDITERKQTQKALEDNLRQLKAAYKQTTIYAQELNEEIIERQRVEKALEQRAVQLSLINDIGGQIAAVLELDGVLNRTARLVQEMFDYHHVALFLLDQAVPRLKAVAGSYEKIFSPEHSQELSKGIIDWVAAQGEKIIGNDVSVEPRYIPSIAGQTITQAELCLPIKVAGQTVGILDIQSPQPGIFSENDVIAMETLTTQIAVAIENARLHEAVQQELVERKRAETALAEERSLLTRRVAERTAELRAANVELARAARLKDEFLTSMSHELRTPLNGILGMSEILQEQVYGALNEKQLSSLRRIEESGRHLLTLINDILDLSKIEAGKLDLQIGPASIESICEASLRIIKQEAHKKQLKISSMIDSDVTTLEVDRRRLKQILVNLLSNAVKFTPAGGQIGLEVLGDPEIQTVRLTVWDTGIGIAVADMKHLFKPFIQLDSSLSRHYEGTGLGLALVYRMVEMHGGSVSVESQVEQGSRFTVSLPWREAERVEEDVEELEWQKTPASQPNSPVSSANLDMPVILLVEDNTVLVEMLMDYLQDVGGYRVVVARDGAEGIERAKSERPAVILMDIQMPGMDGLEATRRIRADAELGKIPIIALTALAMPGDRERCLAAGVNEYLSKPIALQRLIKAVRAQL